MTSSFTMCVCLSKDIHMLSICSLGLFAELDGAFHRLGKLRATCKLEDLLANLLYVLTHCSNVFVGQRVDELLHPPAAHNVSSFKVEVGTAGTLGDERRQFVKHVAIVQGNCACTKGIVELLGNISGGVTVLNHEIENELLLVVDGRQGVRTSVVVVAELDAFAICHGSPVHPKCCDVVLPHDELFAELVQALQRYPIHRIQVVRKQFGTALKHNTHRTVRTGILAEEGCAIKRVA
ncbi:hypothetical protein ATCV1_z127L [Acanthocystis turfacea chlorella virus 1]|uniref:Uncharacterized protein z127L n=1 Tax=Chlorovirus heliozoae TaxID=322019 RepID=A7K887_9PHYC|nr:hypothetical protein ATCV1_z127L [Acanthocystis turfacea chlorella virus 1]ABT16261.1 hypothetical protein ATCV1_z127L [Acanthocystis turfacea chlorella virus 1]